MQTVQFASPPVTGVASPMFHDFPPSYEDQEDRLPSRGPCIKNTRPQSRSRSQVSRGSRGDRVSRSMEGYQVPYHPNASRAQFQPRPYTPSQTWSTAVPERGYSGQAAVNPHSYSLPQEYGYTTGPNGWPQQGHRRQSTSPYSNSRSRSPYDSEKSRKKHHRHSSDSDRSYDYSDEKKRRPRSYRDSHIEYQRPESPHTIEDDAASLRQYRHRRNKTVIGVMGSILAGVVLCSH